MYTKNLVPQPSPIRILPEHEARKIAAGEVVERPASVVKELLENALDAGASEITIAVRDGGKASIVLIDNGSGMSPEDARMCVEHHATSKIHSVDQLSTITTFGFRGEALSSIASVSRLRIVTRRAQDELGYSITLQLGTIQQEDLCAAQIGTTIVVDDLFFNVPARRKFLKQRDTEWRAIQQLVTAYALLYPAIRFVLQHEGVTVLTAPVCSTLLARAQAVVDHITGEQLLPVSYTQGSMSVEGVISNHQHERYDRRQIFCFVNQRWVKNHVLGKGIMSGYNEVLSAHKYPFAVIALTMPSAQVDINIHPRKEEVLLMHPQLASKAIEHAVRKSLTASIAPSPQVAASPVITSMVSAFDAPAAITPSLFDQPMLRHEKSAPVPYSSFAAHQYPPDATVLSQGNSMPRMMHNPISDAVQQRPLVEDSFFAKTNSPPPPAYTYLGQLGATYLLLEMVEGLSIIDQHAAHEAILYGTLQNVPDSSLVIPLIFPQELLCLPHEYAAVQKLQPLLTELGIVLELSPPDMLILRALRAPLQAFPIADFVKELVSIEIEEEAVEKQALEKKLRHALLARIACKSAVKAGDALSAAAAAALIDEFFLSSSRLTCPHGRPTLWRITYRELERCFKRIM